MSDVVDGAAIQLVEEPPVANELLPRGNAFRRCEKPIRVLIERGGSLFGAVIVVRGVLPHCVFFFPEFFAEFLVLLIILPSQVIPT